MEKYFTEVMSTTRAVFLLVIAVVGLTIAPLASAAVVSTLGTGEESGEAESNATVSTFMHASAADAENTVESELFAVKYANADNESRAALVQERTDELEAELDALEAEREALREQKDELSKGQYRARMTKLTVDITALERSIERTKPRAKETGVGQHRLDTLGKNVSELAGPEVARAANGIPGFERAPGQGPMGDDRGPGSDRGIGPPADGSADQTDAGNGSNGKGNSGPPDDPGTGADDGGNGTGNGDGGGSDSNTGDGSDDDGSSPGTDTE